MPQDNMKDFVNAHTPSSLAHHTEIHTPPPTIQHAQGYKSNNFLFCDLTSWRVSSSSKSSSKVKDSLSRIVSTAETVWNPKVRQKLMLNGNEMNGVVEVGVVEDDRLRGVSCSHHPSDLPSYYCIQRKRTAIVWTNSLAVGV